MAGLAEDDLDPRARRRQRLIWVAGGTVVLLVVGALGWGLQRWLGAPAAPARQVARIAVLPDTPPPPPPPPKEQPKPEQKPQADDRPPPPNPTPPPPQAAPADAPLKMDGPAGDGPSPFGAGTVNQDYAGGTPGSGASAAAGAPADDTLADRTQARFYAQASRQTLQGELERLLRTEADELQAGFLLWVDRQGAISRVQLRPTGDAARDDELRAALDEARRSVRLGPPPARLPQPMNFRLTLRPQG